MTQRSHDLTIPGPRRSDHGSGSKVMGRPGGRHPRDHARVTDGFSWRRDNETPAYERRADARFDRDELPERRADAEFPAEQRRPRATAGAAERVIATRRGGAIGAISMLCSAASASATAREWRGLANPVGRQMCNHGILSLIRGQRAASPNVRATTPIGSSAVKAVISGWESRVGSRRPRRGSWEGRGCNRSP